MSTQSDAQRAARLRRTRLATSASTSKVDTTPPESDSKRTRFVTEPARVSALLTELRSRLPRRHKTRKDRLQGWENWSRFRLWLRTRPLWGAIIMILAAAILLAFPLSLLQFAFLVNSFWSSMVVGGILLVMGLISLLLPNYAVITGSIGIVISLVSFITNTFGGLAIGMLLGIIGSALCIAWRPVKRSRLIAASTSTNP